MSGANANVESQKEHNFMKSIYSKVAELRQNIFQYEAGQSHHKSRCQDASAKIFDGKHKTQNKNINPKLTVLKLNEQTKIHRQNLIVKQRFKKQPDQKFYQTFQGFSSITQKNAFKIQNVDFSARKRCYSSQNLHSNVCLYKTNEFGLSQKKKQSQRKRFFSSKLLTQTSNSNKKQSQFISQRKNIQNDQKVKSYSKISRLVNFLDRNDNKLRQTNTKKKQTQNLMNESQQATDNRENDKDEVLFLDSEQGFENHHIFQSLKQQKLELQQTKRFKPIGSAKIFRNKLNANLNAQNLNHEQSQLPNRNTSQQQKLIMIVESKLSSYSKNQSLSKNYLEKGNRFRDVLYKKLLKNSKKKDHQMIYVRQYDQWVPSELIQNNRNELETYMKLLLGQKKEQKTKKITLSNVEPIYY